MNKSLKICTCARRQSAEKKVQEENGKSWKRKSLKNWWIEGNDPFNPRCLLCRILLENPFWKERAHCTSHLIEHLSYYFKTECDLQKIPFNRAFFSCPLPVGSWHLIRHHIKMAIYGFDSHALAIGQQQKQHNACDGMCSSVWDCVCQNNLNIIFWKWIVLETNSPDQIFERRNVNNKWNSNPKWIIKTVVPLSFGTLNVYCSVCILTRPPPPFRS